MTRYAKLTRFMLLCAILVSASVLPAGAGATGGLTPQSVSPAAVSAAATYTTIAGADRYATAVAISKTAYPATVETLVIASGSGWADAVGGGVLAGSSAGPVLLVSRSGPSQATLAEIRRLAPHHVFILGGTESIPETLSAAIAAAAVEATTVVRLAGDDRYATAARVASETIDSFPASWGGQALVASGRNYADALAAGPFAIATHRPIYLIDDAHAAQVAAAMRQAGVRKIAVLGGDAAVSPRARAVLALEFGASNIDVVAGATRYETSTMLTDLAVKYSGFSLSRPGLATGLGFADALTAAPLLAQRRAPLLLAPALELSDSYSDWFYARRASITGFVAFGGDGAMSPRVRQDVLLSLAAPRFDSSRAMTHVRAISGFGPRPAGGYAERSALDYFATQLRSYGYLVRVQTILIPGGTSQNVFAERRGTSSQVIVLGAHADTKAPSPGGNDNASGMATTIELARVLALAPVTPTVRFIAFGAEEIVGSSADAHHFGSRGYVAALPAAQKAIIAGMVSVDMVGYGDTFNVRSMGVGSKTVVYSLQGRATYTGLDLPFLRDPGQYGWSDHEGFERAGIPAAWLEWREDPLYHTTGDTASHVDEACVESAGRLLRGWTLTMSPAQLDALR